MRDFIFKKTLNCVQVEEGSEDGRDRASSMSSTGKLSTDGSTKAPPPPPPTLSTPLQEGTTPLSPAPLVNGVIERMAGVGREEEEVIRGEGGEVRTEGDGASVSDVEIIDDKTNQIQVSFSYFWAFILSIKE